MVNCVLGKKQPHQQITSANAAGNDRTASAALGRPWKCAAMLCVPLYWAFVWNTHHHHHIPPSSSSSPSHNVCALAARVENIVISIWRWRNQPKHHGIHIIHNMAKRGFCCWCRMCIEQPECCRNLLGARACARNFPKSLADDDAKHLNCGVHVYANSDSDARVLANLLAILMPAIGHTFPTQI